LSCQGRPPTAPGPFRSASGFPAMLATPQPCSLKPAVPVALTLSALQERDRLQALEEQRSRVPESPLTLADLQAKEAAQGISTETIRYWKTIESTIDPFTAEPWPAAPTPSSPSVTEASTRTLSTLASIQEERTVGVLRQLMERWPQPARPSSPSMSSVSSLPSMPSIDEEARGGRLPFGGVDYDISLEPLHEAPAQEMEVNLQEEELLLEQKLEKIRLVRGAATRVPVPPLYRGRRRRLSHREVLAFKAAMFPEECGVTQVNMVINSYLFFDRAPETATVVDDVTARLLKFGRFTALAGEDGRMRPVETRPEDHVTYHAAADENEVLQIAAELTDQPLDLDKPLWHFHIVANQGEGPSLVLARVHSALADGLSLLKVLSELGEGAGGSRLAPRADRVGEHRRQAPSHTPVAAATGDAGQYAMWWQSCSARSGRSIGDKLEIPAVTPGDDGGVDHKCFGCRGNPKYSGLRTAVFFPPISMPFINALKGAADATVNDVLYCATAGMIRRYREAHGHINEGKMLKVLQTVATPPAEQPDVDNPWDCLTNSWTYVSCELDLTPLSPRERMCQNTAHCSPVKDPRRAHSGMGLLESAAPRWGAEREQELYRNIFAQHSLVLSNIPGPPQDVFVFGQQVRTLQVVFQTLIPQLVAVTLNGSLHLNLVADPEAVADMETLPGYFVQELSDLGAALGVAADPVA